MTGPERKRNELKLDFDLEKNAIKKQGRKFNKTEKNVFLLIYHLS